MQQPENPYASPASESLYFPDDDDDRLSAPGLQRTAKGLGLVYYGILIILVTLIATIALMFATGFAAGASQGARVMVLPFFIMGGGMIVGGLTVFVGEIFCLSVPPQTEARGLITSAVVLRVLGMIVSFGTAFTASASSAAVVASKRLQNPGPGNLLGLIGGVLFVLFLRKVAQYIERDDLAQRASRILWLGLASFLLLLVGGAAVAATGAPAGLVVILVTVAIGIGLAMFGMYVNLINALRKALQLPQRQDRQPRQLW